MSHNVIGEVIEMLGHRNMGKFRVHHFSSNKFLDSVIRDTYRLINDEKSTQYVYILYDDVKVKIVKELPWEDASILLHYSALHGSPRSFFAKRGIDCFDIVFFQCPVIKHLLYQSHTLIEPAEESQFLANNRLEKKKMPQIMSTDPVVRYFGWRKHSIVRIERKWLNQVYFRVIR